MLHSPRNYPGKVLLPISRNYDEKVDVYALGVCIYQLAYNVLPYRGESKKEYWSSTLSDQVFLHEGCPEELIRLMRKMLEK
jgi:serine/threonine protein kinase